MARAPRGDVADGTSKQRSTHAPQHDSRLGRTNSLETERPARHRASKRLFAAMRTAVASAVPSRSRRAPHTESPHLIPTFLLPPTNPSTLRSALAPAPSTRSLCNTFPENSHAWRRAIPAASAPRPRRTAAAHSRGEPDTPSSERTANRRVVAAPPARAPAPLEDRRERAARGSVDASARPPRRIDAGPPWRRSVGRVLPPSVASDAAMVGRGLGLGTALPPRGPGAARAKARSGRPRRAGRGQGGRSAPRGSRTTFGAKKSQAIGRTLRKAQMASASLRADRFERGRR